MAEKDYPSYSQCPGECYDVFWEEQNKDEVVFDIEKLTKGLRWTGEEWVKVTTSYRVDFFTKGQSELQWKYFNTMEAAIAAAHCMVVSGEYSVEAINPDTSPTE
jgi:hypothetical protein